LADPPALRLAATAAFGVAAAATAAASFSPLPFVLPLENAGVAAAGWSVAAGTAALIQKAFAEIPLPCRRFQRSNSA
jgi:hypothetical protein